MQFVPWRRIADWKCISCGGCCKFYSVVIDFPEWLNIVKNFGAELTVSEIDKLFIKRNPDGSCAFLHKFSNTCMCGLQHMKPKACKLWPFKVLDAPKFGHPNDAFYYYGGNSLFVYADLNCKGLEYGTPRWEFANQTLSEFIEIAVGLRNTQSKTTSDNFLSRLKPESLFMI